MPVKVTSTWPEWQNLASQVCARWAKVPGAAGHVHLLQEARSLRRCLPSKEKKSQDWLNGTPRGRTCFARYAHVHVNGLPAKFKVDSGAEVTVVPSNFPAVPKNFDRAEAKLTGTSNLPLPVLATFSATFSAAFSVRARLSTFNKIIFTNSHIVMAFWDSNAHLIARYNQPVEIGETVAELDN